MATSKTIYFTGDLFERATEGIEKGDVSKRINELIRNGLKYEKGDKITFEKALGYFNKMYLKKNPNGPLPIS
jgi:hypothetical protein